jgi:hypothetical protein
MSLLTYCITRILGWSALSGVVVVLVAFILNYPLAQYDISVSIIFSQLGV